MNIHCRSAKLLFENLTVAWTMSGKKHPIPLTETDMQDLSQYFHTLKGKQLDQSVEHMTGYLKVKYDKVNTNDLFNIACLADINFRHVWDTI